MQDYKPLCYLISGSLIILSYLYFPEILSKIDLNYAYYFNVIMNYITKIPDYTLDYKLPLFSFATALNKSVMIHFMYNSDKNFDFAGFMDTIRTVMVFVIIGFSVPRKFLTAVYNI